MKATLLLTLLVTMNTTYALNCLSDGVDGPQDGADLNRCMKVIDQDSGKYINCLSDDVDGPQDGAEVYLCENVKN